MSKVNFNSSFSLSAPPDGRQLDPVVGLPDGKIAACAQYITGNSQPAPFSGYLAGSTNSSPPPRPSADMFARSISIHL
jgi:hypothetical protein